jgi:hypothetical protein
MWVWELTLGIIFFVAWVCLLGYAQSVRRSYMLGQIDYITHRNRRHDYEGVALWAYNKGRKKKAVEYKLSVRGTARN